MYFACMVPHSHRTLLLCLVFVGLLFIPSKLCGQGMGGSKRIEGKTKFMPIPYLNYDQSKGFTIGAVPMLMFNPSEKDTISPSSLIGGVGTWSTNKSWFLLAFGKFYLAEDNWRITTGGGIGTSNFQFYLDDPSGGWIPYESEADFFMLKVERRIYKKLYGGVSYIWANVISTSETTSFTDSLTVNGIGLNLSLDTRKNPYYPRNGYFTTVKYNNNPLFLGNETNTRKIQIDHDQYFSTRQKKDVVAARLHAGFGIGDLSFNQQFIVKGTDIRGYTQGAYRGNYILTLQGEYRWNFHRRWGAVGFAGVATVFEAINESDNGKLLPGIGTGLRFRVFPETNLSVGLDVAKGIDDWGIYFQIGEAF